MSELRESIIKRIAENYRQIRRLKNLMDRQEKDLDHKIAYSRIEDADIYNSSRFDRENFEELISLMCKRDSLFNELRIDWEKRA